MSQLEKIKKQLGIKDESQDSLLELLLEDAAEDIMLWTNRTILTKPLESAQRQITIIRFNKQGIEGQTSHSEGGVSRAFEDLPNDVQSTIHQFRLLKAVRHATSTT